MLRADCRHVCNLLILDMHLPDENGLNLLDEIRNGITWNADIQVPIISGDADHETVRWAAQLGVQGLSPAPTSQWVHDSSVNPP